MGELAKVQSYGPRTCRHLDQALANEWCEKNAIGGFASSTIISVNTRRNHGLLVVPLGPTSKPHVFLSGLEEFLFVGDCGYPLSTLIYPHTVYPKGHRNLEEFCVQPYPTWIYSVEDIILAKSIMMLHCEQTVFIRYQILAGDEDLVRLEMRPLTAFRRVSTLAQLNGGLNHDLRILGGRIYFAPYPKKPGLYFHHNAAIVDQSGIWFQRIQYLEEKKCLFDFEEDLYSPFRLGYTLLGKREVFLCVTVSDRETIELYTQLCREEEQRRKNLTGNNAGIADTAGLEHWALP